METIISINDFSARKGKYSTVEGYKIITDKQEIELGIDGDQQCCESFGYFMCNDKLEDFIGSQVLDITLTNTALNTEILKESNLDPTHRYFEGDVMFVNIETNQGTLQFVAYNEHNGYYGHRAYVSSTQLTTSEYL